MKIINLIIVLILLNGGQSNHYGNPFSSSYTSNPSTGFSRSNPFSNSFLKLRLFCFNYQISPSSYGSLIPTQTGTPQYYGTSQPSNYGVYLNHVHTVPTTTNHVHTIPTTVNPIQSIPTTVNPFQSIPTQTQNHGIQGGYPSSVVSSVRGDENNNNYNINIYGGGGQQGIPGINGTNGINGINGINGQDGQDGKDGQDGQAGLPGPAGPPGQD